MFYRVSVRYNIVQEIRQQANLGNNDILLNTNLEAGRQLTRNFQRFGHIDAEYIFDDFERTKAFAAMCMDFIHKLITHRTAEIEKLDRRQNYIADQSV